MFRLLLMSCSIALLYSVHYAHVPVCCTTAERPQFTPEYQNNYNKVELNGIIKKE